ncbi:MAG: hypothetical protein H0V09_08570, partial [Gemmatimonadetes bacterium]|nr:hypothetical protein [Gemmatimonadota bacterium]
MPPAAPGDGLPRLRVVYPPAGATLTASDSTFVFGSVSPAGASVTVNGVAAEQAPGGGWLAWVPVTPGPFVFRVEASGGEAGGAAAAARIEHPVHVPGAFAPSWNAVFDSSSVTPHDSLELDPGDV